MMFYLRINLKRVLRVLVCFLFLSMISFFLKWRGERPRLAEFDSVQFSSGMEMLYQVFDARPEVASH